MTRTADDPNKIVYRDLAVVQLHEVENNTLEETADKLNLSKTTIKRIKKKPAYHELATMAMEDKKLYVDYWIEKLREGAEAKKDAKLNKEGEVVEIPDHPTRFKFIDRALNIYGVDPPKEVTHTLATISDADLAEELARASREYGVD
jgi:predicted DNA-binding protein (UPF0251 family)